MKEFNLERINQKMKKMGEQSLTLKKTKYKKPKVKDGYLVDSKGNRIGTKGDMYTKIIMDKILEEGCLDENPRPHYEDFYEHAKYDEKKKVITLEN